MRLPSKPFHFVLLVVAVLGSVYVYTLLPGPGYSGDAAKFQFIGGVLGTPHEPGYPTYVLLNYLFVSLFPFGTLAYKANLLSVFCSVGASLVLFAVLHRTGTDRLIAFITTIAFGFGYTVWSQSIIAEVYSLNLLFISLITYFFMRWHWERKNWLFYTACLIYALSFGNHLTMITALPAIVYLVWVTDKTIFLDSKKITRVLFIVILGAAQYGYIFWRTQNPGTPYVEVSVTDWQSFWASVSGGHFSHLLFGFSLRWVLLDRLPALVLFFFREMMFLLPFTVSGWIVLRKKKVNVFLLLLLAGNFLFCLGYAIYDIFVYLMPVYFICAIFAGHGLQALGEVIKNQIPIPAAFLIIPIVSGFLNLGFVNQRDNSHDDNKAQEVLRAADQDAILVCPDYHYAMILWYHVLAGEWNNRNIHIAFYHNQQFPSAEISAYLSGRALYIPVTRDSVQPGLKICLFMDSFDLRMYQPFGVGKKEPAEAQKLHEIHTSRLKTELAAVGVEMKDQFNGFYLLTKKHKNH